MLNKKHCEAKKTKKFLCDFFAHHSKNREWKAKTDSWLLPTHKEIRRKVAKFRREKRDEKDKMSSDSRFSFTNALIF